MSFKHFQASTSAALAAVTDRESHSEIDVDATGSSGRAGNG